MNDDLLEREMRAAFQGATTGLALRPDAAVRALRAEPPAERRRRTSLVIGVAASVVALIGAVAVLTHGSSHRRSEQLIQPAGDPRTSTTWIATELPDGFRLRRTQHSQGPHEIDYVGDHASINIIAGTLGQGFDGQPGTDTTVRGHPASLSVLHSDGSVIGHALIWEERPGFAIEVKTDNPAKVSDKQLLQVAEHVGPLTDQQWQTLSTGTDTNAPYTAGYVGTLLQTAVHSGDVAGRPYELTALVPPGYPLSDDDQRTSCLTLTYAGDPRPRPLCATDPGVQGSFTVLAGRPFVIGIVPSDHLTVHVRTSSYDAVVDTYAAPTGPSVRYYVAPLPPGSCYVTIADLPLTPQGGFGPLPSDVGYVECLATLGQTPPPFVLMARPTAAPGSPPYSASPP